MFKKISTGFGATAIFVGLMMAAGSAGDCDGKCMEQANTIGEMLMVAGIGAAMIAFGAMILLSNRAEG